MGRRKKEVPVEVIELEINPIFAPLFYDNLDDPRYYQIFGGRGSGKSFAVAMAMVELTYSPYKHKILYLRQAMTSSTDSTIADIRNAIELLGVQPDFMENKGAIYNKTTGASIIFKGIRSTGSQTAKLKSLSGVTTLVVEEAEELESFEEFSKIDESIRLNNKPLKVILIYNPTSAIQSWIHKEWFKEGLPSNERHHDTMYIHSTYLDNLENLHPSVIQRYRDLEQTNPTYYKNTILAEWTLEVEGRIYAGWGEYESFDNEGDTWYGLDFGYGGSDKTSLIKITYFEDTYYVEELFSVAKMKIKKTISEMKKKIPWNAKIFADSAMPLLIDEIRDGGFKSIRKARKGNVEAGIKKVQNKNIIMVGENPGLYYAYNTFKRNDKGKLPHEPDELAALRYGINSRKPIKRKTKKEPVPDNKFAKTKRRVRRVKGFI